MGNRFHRLTCLLLLLLATTPVLAHHSYADYERAERYELRGTITEIHWGNPHILFTVHTDTVDMRIEWVTVTGADKTLVRKDQFAIGDELIVIGSRNLNPDTHVMTLVKELQMPQKDFRWISPSLTNAVKRQPSAI